MTSPQWSRPGTGSEPGTPVVLIRGVRPNSPMTSTSVESSRPRCVEVVDQAADGRVEDRQDRASCPLSRLEW